MVETAFIRTICFPVQVLGPGQRIGIWFSGCSRNCNHCMGQTLKKRLPVDEVKLCDVFQAIAKRADAIDGASISGGEPFDQPEALLSLVCFLEKNVTEDILVYSGFTKEEIERTPLGAEILRHIAILIDGPYVSELDDGVGIRGSSNQVVHRLKDVGSFDYQGCLRKKQAFIYGDDAFIVGLESHG